ncbi:MAG: hypothetical protein D6725_11405, partial [Planctomycetota bacterium]
GRDKPAHKVGTATYPGSLEGKDVVFSVTITLPQGVNALPQPVQVSYSTFDATDMKNAARHVAGTKPSEAQDYQKTSGMLVFPAGAQDAALTQTIAVKTIADEMVEEDEPFYLELVGIQNAQLNGPARATGYVRNNDVTVDLFAPHQGYQVKEGEPAKIIWSRSGIRTAMLNGLDVYVRVWTKSVTATPNTDYDHIAKNSQQSLRRVTNDTFPTVMNVLTFYDSLHEQDELFFVLMEVDAAKTSPDAQVTISEVGSTALVVIQDSNS